MKIRLPADQVRKVSDALALAGDRETGGQIFAEQLAPSDFLVTEIAVQKKRGSFARFVVDVIQAARDAATFFARTSHRYTKFNYLGEWHSHPCFPVKPSDKDRNTMRELVTDPAFKGNFAVLMIAKMESNTLAAGAWVFDAQANELPVTLELEQ